MKRLQRTSAAYLCACMFSAVLSLHPGAVLGTCPVTNEVGGDLPLRLPFQTGRSFPVTQGYCDGDHDGYQVDFRMPSNTVVVATAAGIVVETGDNAANCPTGCGSCVLDGGIYVKIRHQGAMSNWY